MTLTGIEDAIVVALRASTAVEFNNDKIVVGTTDDAMLKTLLSSGGITVQYAGSRTLKDLAHGMRLERRCVFIVTVGRKMISEGRRLTQDIEGVVDAVTGEDMDGAQLAWIEDRFARSHNGVNWHDIIFQTTVSAI